MKFIISETDEILVSHSGLALAGSLLQGTTIVKRANRLRLGDRMLIVGGCRFGATILGMGSGSGFTNGLLAGRARLPPNRRGNDATVRVRWLGTPEILYP